ncbi:MAG: tryptophan synthase subunit alpha [Fluviibacter sp.]
MGRITDTFAALATQGKKGLIPYIMAGDPSPALTVDLMHALVEGGADVIELGVPFSDPMADGPVIQRAAERAIAQGIGLHQTLAMVAEFRKQDQETPIVLMGYANPIECLGQTAFVAAAKAAGVDGVLVVDYPPEESDDFAKQLRAVDMDPIYLLAPTSTEERIAAVAKVASGYLYYVSLKGVTGAGHLDLHEVSQRIPQIRQRTGLPVGVGFGIRDASTAERLAGMADAVVVGSRLIDAITDVPQSEARAALLAVMKDIRAGVDKAASKK